MAFVYVFICFCKVLQCFFVCVCGLICFGWLLLVVLREELYSLNAVGVLYVPLFMIVDIGCGEEVSSVLCKFFCFHDDWYISDMFVVVGFLFFCGWLFLCGGRC